MFFFLPFIFCYLLGSFGFPFVCFVGLKALACFAYCIVLKYQLFVWSSKVKEKKLTQKHRIEKNTFPIKDLTRLSNNIWSS
jgi:hypothetical protein